MELPSGPILAGTYPDPSIQRVDGDYYLVTSTMEYFPALPIFHSTDLVSWTQVGHVIDRIDQLDLATVPSSGGLFAPTIRWAKGVWYVVCTLVHGEGRQGNFLVTSERPTGPWSDPIWLDDAPGIDPSTLLCLSSGWDRVLAWNAEAALVTGQLPLSPVVLAAGGACGAVADGGMSTRRARGGKFSEEISDEGAPQGHFLHRRPRRRRG